MSFPQSSVADPGCLSRFPDPDFYPSRIPDPKTATKERDEKNIFCHTIFCSHKFHKNVNYLIFEMLKKIIWANFQRIIELFYQKKLSISSEKYGFGIQDPEKTYSGSRGRKGTGSRIQNTAAELLIRADFFLCVSWQPVWRRLSPRQMKDADVCRLLRTAGLSTASACRGGQSAPLPQSSSLSHPLCWSHRLRPEHFLTKLVEKLFKLCFMNCR